MADFSMAEVVKQLRRLISISENTDQNIQNIAPAGGTATAVKQDDQTALLTSIESNTSNSGQPAETTGFVTTSNLNDGLFFQSALLDVDGYSQVQTEVFADQDGTMLFEFCADAGGTDVVRSLTVPYTAANGYQLFAAPAFTNYIRYRFTNDSGANQTDFYFTTKLLTTAISPQTLRIDGFLSPAMMANVSRSVTVGDDPNGIFTNLPASGVVDDQSTTDTLGAGAAFNAAGPWTDLTGYGGLTVLLDGTTGGNPADGTLQMQFSHDGATVNRDITIAVADIRAAAPRTLGTVAKYFRVIYTNGSEPHTSTDIQTMFHLNQVTLVGRLDQVIGDDADVQLVRSVNAGQQPDGDFVNNPADGLAFNTSTPLGIGATYTSPWVDTDGYNTIQIHIEADVVGADRGIDVQFTNDVQAGGGPTVIEEFFYTFSQIDVDRGYLELDFPTKMDGFRFIYENGSVGQTTFIVEADLRTNATPNRYDPGGALIVGDFKKEVVLNNIPNYTGSSKFGLVTATDAADPIRTVWAMANDDGVNVLNRKTFPTVAGTLHMASDNSGDTAKEITVVYNDTNNIERTISFDLDGTDAQTPVSLGVTALDVNTAYITEPDGSLLGNVYFSLNNLYTDGVPTTLSDTIAFIPLADGRTQQATYRVPANTKMLLETMYITVSRTSGGDGSALVKLLVKPNGKAWYTARPYSCTTQNIIDRQEDLVFNAGDLIEVVVANVSDTDTDVNVVFDYELVQV